MEASDLGRMKHLGEQNARLRSMVADLRFIHETTKDPSLKRLLTDEHREAVVALMSHAY